MNKEETKVAKKLVDKVIKSKGFKRVPQGTAAMTNGNALEYKFGDNFVLSMNVESYDWKWIGSFRLMYSSRFKHLNTLNYDKIGYRIHKRFVTTVATNKDDRADADEKNFDKMLERFEDFLESIKFQRERGLEEILKLPEYDMKAVVALTDPNSIDLLVEIVGDGVEANSKLYDITSNVRFLPEEARDIFFL